MLKDFEGAEIGTTVAESKNNFMFSFPDTSVDAPMVFLSESDYNSSTAEKRLKETVRLTLNGQSFDVNLKISKNGGYILPMEDQWGRRLHYYVMEDTGSINDAYFNTNYDHPGTVTSGDFVVNNTYQINRTEGRHDYVEVHAWKQWEEGCQRSEITRFQLIASYDGREEVVSEERLVGTANKIVFTELNVRTSQLYVDPSSNGGKYAKIPYFAPNGQPYVFEVREVLPRGYTSNKATHAVKETPTTYAQAKLKEILDNDDTAAKNKLEAYMRAHGTELKETDNKGQTTTGTMANDKQGLYLVVETYVPEDVYYTTDPFFVSLPMTDHEGESWFYDVHTYPKNQTDYPTLTKTVADADDSDLTNEDFTLATSAYGDSATASEGDTLNMRIIARIPKITSDVTNLTEFTFKDRQTPGLSYDKTSVKIAIYDSLDKAKTNDPTQAATNGNWGTSGTNFTATFTDHDTTNHENTMTIEMTTAGLGIINENSTPYSNTPGYADFSGYYMVVYYTAKVDTDAHQDYGIVLGDVGNDAPVSLTWTRTSTENTHQGGTYNTAYHDTIQSNVRVFTYGIDLKKIFAGDSTNYSAVKFTLRNKTNDAASTTSYQDIDDYYIIAQETTSGSGIYNVVESDGADGKSPTKGNNTAALTKFSPNSSSGELKIYGLEGGTYELVEVDTDNGYSLLRNPITIVIDENTGTVTDSLPNDQASTTLDYPTTYVEFDYTKDHATATVDEQEATMNAHTRTVAPLSSANATVHLEITNSPSFLLPQTGGTGMWLVTILGVLGVAGGVLLLKKNDRAEEK